MARYDHFENATRAQLIIADIPYNLGNNAYASDPRWYKDGESFFETDNDFKINNFFYTIKRKTIYENS